jgi:hypothetical protein
MKKTSLLISCILLSSSVFAQTSKFEIGFQGALWNSIWNGSGSEPGSKDFIRSINSSGFQNYPFNLFDFESTSRRAEYDHNHTMPMLRFFARRNFQQFYFGSGINFTREDISFRMPYNAPFDNLSGHLLGVSTANIEVPLYIGHRLDFFEYIRVYAGIIPTYSIKSKYQENFGTHLNGADREMHEDINRTLLEIQQGFIDSYRSLFFSGSAGVGFDYRFITLDLQIDRSLSMSRNSATINGSEFRMNERKTRKMLWIGFKIPLN